jgi:hypothetical protein
MWGIISYYGGWLIGARLPTQRLIRVFTPLNALPVGAILFLKEILI